MKKILLILPTFFWVNVAKAQDYWGELFNVQDEVGFEQTSIPALLGNIIQVVLSILGVVLLVIIIYAGFLWMTAGGDSDKVKKARDWILNAVIGLIITLAAYSITWFVIDALSAY